VALFFKDFFRFFRRRGEPLDAEYIVFGIGNTGSGYENTRHNVGFMVVDRCLARCRSLKKNKVDNAEVAAGEFSGAKVAFVKPTTFVNRCGPAFKSSATALRVPLGSCMAVVDDYNLPLGSIRFRAGGSDGGHNGLKSIIESVGREFPRLRIGIGPLPKETRPVDFVLGVFSPEEVQALVPVIDKAVEGIAVFLKEGLEKAMMSFNGPPDKKEP
jgi:peptidyl-tRNA hydrolase, PTH1 family